MGSKKDIGFDPSLRGVIVEVSSDSAVVVAAAHLAQGLYQLLSARL